MTGPERGDAPVRVDLDALLREPDDRPPVVELLANLRRDHAALADLLASIDDHDRAEDLVYRFWHQSWKVYGLQNLTLPIVERLRSLAPAAHEQLDAWFEQIVEDGTGRAFHHEVNQRWLEETRPIVEAFWHARWFLEVAVRYGAELESAPRLLPSGWAALLTLYGLR